LVAAVLCHFEGHRFELHAFVIMNDHVHVVVTPGPGRELEQLVHTWKSFSAWKLQRIHGRVGVVWLEEYYDHIVRSPAELLQKVTYVARNPERRWPGTVDYLWLRVGLRVDGHGGPSNAGSGGPSNAGSGGPSNAGSGGPSRTGDGGE
jgi:hypothetical protein